MRKVLCFFVFITAISCQREMEPTIANINSIYDTQDFQIKFEMNGGEVYRMGFLNNDMAFFSPAQTLRRELSYDDVRLINTFVEARFRESVIKLKSESQPERDQVEIYNDSKRVVFQTPEYRTEFESLLTQLNLPYVPIKKK
jgi:hypothetical protein